MPIENVVKSVDTPEGAIPSEGLVSTKWCQTCRETKQADAFYTRISKISGKLIFSEASCKPCLAAKRRQRYHADPAFAANVRRIDRKSRRTRLALMTAEEREAFRLYGLAKDRRNDAILKEAAYAAYGGYRCSCCGETVRAFLTLDHVNNDGAAHRRAERKHSSHIYRWARDNGYPKSLQVLCMNCNWGKRTNNGICPHQTTRNDYPERE